MNTKIILAVVLAIIVVAAWAVNAHRNKGFKTVMKKGEATNASPFFGNPLGFFS